LLDKALHFKRIALPVAMALDGTRAAGSLDIDIAEQHSGIHTHRGDVRDMDRMLGSANPTRCVMNDGGRRDLHLGGKQTVPGTQPTGAENMPGVKGRPFRQMITIKMRRATMAPIAAMTHGDWKSS